MKEVLRKRKKRNNVVPLLCFYIVANHTIHPFKKLEPRKCVSHSLGSIVHMLCPINRAISFSFKVYSSNTVVTYSIDAKVSPSKIK